MGKALRPECLSRGLKSKRKYLQATGDLNSRRATLILAGAFFVAVLVPAAATLAQSPNPDGGELDPTVAAHLRERIENGGDDEQRTALAEIRNLRSASASRLAVPALRDKDERVRATAAASVVFLPPVEASSALTPLLNDKAEFVRREAAYALGEVRSPAPVPDLIRLMRRDKISEVRSAAAISLGKIGDASALESLLTILRGKPSEDTEFIRRSAARSIGQIAQISETGDPTVLTPQNFLPEKFKELGSATTATPPTFSAEVEILTRVLRNDNESDDTRREAAFALGAVGNPTSLATLQPFTSSPDPYMAEISKEAILKINRRRSAGPSGNSTNR